ncbi:hypothetical protein [Streptomyces sp. bgisy100]|uniref:hypothetical protein n=1 Tax=Streptomyces sp. bgisy100 TaxID=3413783 RepID=UPI003D71BAF0
MRRRTTSALSVAAAAFLLAACGGGTEKKSDEISGANKGQPSASSSTSTADDHVKRPKMPFPGDYKSIADWKAPTDSQQAAALKDALNFSVAIRHGVIEQDANDPAYLFYAAPGSAKEYAKDQIQKHIDGGWTLTGTERWSRPEVRVSPDGKRAAVSFCHDQSKLYGREVKTKKVLRTKESDKDYSVFELVMERAPEENLWRAKSIEVKGEATQCKDVSQQD